MNIYNTQLIPNFGRTRYVYWLRFTVENQSSVKWYLLMDALLDEDLDLYIAPKDESPTINRPPLAQRINDHRRAVWSFGKILQGSQWYVGDFVNNIRLKAFF